MVGLGHTNRYIKRGEAPYLFQGETQLRNCSMQHACKRLPLIEAKRIPHEHYFLPLKPRQEILLTKSALIFGHSMYKCELESMNHHRLSSEIFEIAYNIHY